MNSAEQHLNNFVKESKETDLTSPPRDSNSLLKEQKDVLLGLRELKWKELMSRVDAYRFYIKLILELNAFFYATTGAVLLFYLPFALKQPNNYLEFFLLLPILMGTVVGGFLRYATALQRHNSEIIERIRAELRIKYKMEMEEIPDLKLLNKLLKVFGYIFLIVALSLSVLVPFLLGLNSWFSMNFWPKIWLAVFALMGLFIAAAGWKYSGSMIREFDRKRKRRSSMPANSDETETKQRNNRPQPEV